MALVSDVFHKSGVEEAIRALVRAEIERSKQHYVSPYLVGWLYATIGEKDSAFYWLTKAYDMHEMSLALLKVDRWPDPVRSDPRYADLLRRTGLPQ